MNIHKIIVLFSLATSPLALADVNQDLLTAIETGNVREVEKALAQGADLDTTRSGDNHSARSLAVAKILESAECQQTILIAASAALSLPLMALWQKPKCAIPAIIATTAGVLLTLNNSNSTIAKIKNLRIDQLLVAAGGLGVLSLAWKAPENWQLLVNALGTAGLITFLYKSYQLLKRLQVYSLVNPEEYELTPDNTQAE